MSKNKIRIVLLENVHESAHEVFHEHGYSNIQAVPDSLPENELKTKIHEAHMIGIRSRTQVSQDVLQQAEKLIAVGCFCIGTNQVDTDFAAKRGIPVFNAPHSNTRSVAELVIGLTIMLLRDIFPKSIAAHRNQWIKSAKNSFEVRGKVMGIVGYGHIGSQVSILAESLGMRVIYYDIKTKLPLGNARRMNTLERLLRKSDIVTLHVPEDLTTRNLINEKSLQLMKSSAALINASRGSVVDVAALADILRSGRLRGAAVDVFPKEPSSQDEAFDSPLIGLDNVILTPHIGGSTLEAQENIGEEVATKLVFFSDRGSTEGAVNFPIVNLPPNQRTHRILHIHENKPGLLRAINERVAQRGINVKGQFLETMREIGYVVLDVDHSLAREDFRKLQAELSNIEGTIRTRILY